MNRDFKVPVKPGGPVTCIASLVAPKRLRADAERNRDAVIATAQRLLAADPGTTVDEIAAASGVGRTTVFRHFPTKQALLDAVGEHFLDVLELHLSEIDVASLPASAGLEALLRLAAAIPAEFPFIRALMAHRPPEDDPDHLRVLAITQTVHVLMERGQSEGVLRRDVPSEWLAQSFVSLTETMIAALASGGSLASTQPDQVVELILGQFLHGMGR